MRYKCHRNILSGSVIIIGKKKKIKFKGKAIKVRIDFQLCTLLERTKVDNAFRKFPLIDYLQSCRGSILTNTYFSWKMQTYFH